MRSVQRLSFETIAWKRDHLRLLDQTQLPGKLSFVDCFTVEEVWKAIREMVVRGAPAIGVAAGYGLYLAVSRVRAERFADFYSAVEKACQYLEGSRPTGRNLKVILERLRSRVLESEMKGVAAIKQLLLEEAQKAQAEDLELCEAIATHGARLIGEGEGILTHCNAGALATAGIGTALGIIYRAFWDGKKIKVYSSETRPVLQGARLTVWELEQNGVPVELVCEGAVGALFREGRIRKVLVGADRIVANGDTANKIGTYSAAVLARHHGVPFYVAAPTTTFDFTLREGREIPIEIRDRREVTEWEGKKIAPDSVPVYNPAFDVTPNDLIDGIVTERGVFYPPYEDSLKVLREAP